MNCCLPIVATYRTPFLDAGSSHAEDVYMSWKRSSTIYFEELKSRPPEDLIEKYIDKPTSHDLERPNQASTTPDRVTVLS